MNVQDERMWAEVLEAHTPNAAEMAEAEAELQALGDVAPLPAADVEALVELAVKTPPVVVEGRGVVGRVVRSRRFQKPILQAAAAVLLLMAVAWVARELLWTEGKNSDYTLDYATAVNLATQPDRDDGYYMNALSQIVRNCGEAAKTLQSLANQDAYPTLATKARLVSLELVALLTNGPSAPSRPVDERECLVESAATAADEQLAVEVREKALDHVNDLAKSGLTAMWLAPLEGDEAKQHRDNWIARLKRTLPR